MIKAWWMKWRSTSGGVLCYVEIHWKNRIRNDEIHFKIGVAPIDENMREGRLRWFRGDD